LLGRVKPLTLDMTRQNAKQPSLNGPSPLSA